MCLLCVLIWANLCALYQQMSHFDISYMYTFVDLEYGFFPLCVTKISDFFLIFPIVSDFLLVYLYILYISCVYYSIWCPLVFNEVLIYWVWCYLQGSPRGYLLELRFYCVDLNLVMVWS